MSFSAPTTLAIALLGLAAYWAYSRLYYYRFQQYAYLPQYRPSLVWGHLKTIHEVMQQYAPHQPDRTLDFTLRDMMKNLGDPPIMLVDLRPLSLPLLVIADHEVAEQVSRASKLFPYSVFKSPTTYFLKNLTGEQSILHAEGESWKKLRRRYNPGFAPQHLLTLLPRILDKIDPFLSHLDQYAATGEEFRMDEICTNLTFDIIGAVTMSEDFGAQLPPDQQSDFIKLYRQLVESYAADTGVISAWFQPFTTMKRRRLGKQIDPLLERLIRDKVAQDRQQQQQRPSDSASSDKPSRSILALSLSDAGPDPSAELVHATRDQLKTFLFAGHDTTSVLLQWIFYELSRTPRVRAALTAELDSVLGPDPDPAHVRSRLLSADGEDLVRRLTYASAVIKETLRLYPPAGSARWAPPGTGLCLKMPRGGAGLAAGQEVPVDDMALYNCAPLIQSDPRVYGPDSAVFRPERWLGNADTSMMTNDDAEGGGAPSEKQQQQSGIPAAAWRPFERGPRNCIGQELANVEARVILACAVRRYEFVKMGLGKVSVDEEGRPLRLDENGQWVAETQLYQIRQVTSKPVDGMLMKVRLATTEN